MTNDTAESHQECSLGTTVEQFFSLRCANISMEPTMINKWYTHTEREKEKEREKERERDKDEMSNTNHTPRVARCFAYSLESKSRNCDTDRDGTVSSRQVS
jgi:hypothetical protein